MEGNKKEGSTTEENSKEFWSGFATGLLVMLTCLLTFVMVTMWTGTVDWRGLLMHGSGSVVSEKNLQKLKEIGAYVDGNYFDEIDEEQMENALSKGALAGLGDDYAAYYDEAEYEKMQEKTYGSYYGIGAYVTQNATTGAIFIISTIEGGPAQKAGLQGGDVIEQIEGTSVKGMDLSETVSMIKGKEGTKVKITISREGASKPVTYSVARENIETPTVAHELLKGDIGYIRVSSFEDVTKDQFRKAVKDLEKKGEKALIIDLRNNGGGMLTSAVDMLDRMLPKGVVVYTMDKNGKKKEYTSDDKESFEKPVAILVNGNSASASEVFSGAMQDYGKAVLVGTRTFGKGIVQSVYTLSDGTAIKFTTSKYYTPNGRCIHGTGLEPDLKVELEETEKNDEKMDNQLQEAVEYLQKK